MNLAWQDISIILLYLILVVLIGFWAQKKATATMDNYYLAGRSLPWWILGLAGCSSYIDIGGTMAMVGALYYLGLKSVWMTHIFWGWFIICFYMAFQAKWIRRSGVMTFAEWNETRFGKTRAAEHARLAAAIFLLVLMIFNLMFIAVGIGKFAEELLPISRWSATLIVFLAVGVYVTLAGFFGVVLTDILQTILLAIGAILLSVMVFSNPGLPVQLAQFPDAWQSLAPTWRLWDNYLATTPASYHHFYLFGPLILVGFSWMIFRILAGPNVWDFQFFLTARSARDAALAGGLWTVGYTIRWIMAGAFLMLGLSLLGAQAGFDAEKIMPLVLTHLPIGLRGMFLAVLLAALMSTLDAMINVTSSVVVNDFLKRYFAKNLKESQLVRAGQIASIIALGLGFAFSLLFDHVISVWETMIFVVVTMILVPATMRWHWWRFSARAFVWSMIVSAVIILAQKIIFPQWPITVTLGVDVGLSFIATVILGFVLPPTDKNVLVEFYSRVQPFGFWQPIRALAIQQGRIDANDHIPTWDFVNGLITMVFQFSLALIPFYAFLRQWTNSLLWATIFLGTGGILYYTWYKKLPSREEN